MTMRGQIFLFILAISGMTIFLMPSLAAAQGKNIAEVLQEKENQGSGMKGRSFKKPKPAEAPAAPSAAESGAEGEYSEIVEDAGAGPEKEQRPPEEDVWEKYKSIAAGSESKTLTRKSYAVGKEENTHTKKIRKPKSAEKSEEDTESEDTDDSADKDEEKEAEAPKKKKGGMAGILEDYKNKQTNKKPIRGHILNQ